MFKVLPPTAFFQHPLLEYLPARHTLVHSPVRDSATGLAILEKDPITREKVTRLLFPHVEPEEKIAVFASPANTLPFNLYYQYGALQWDDSTSVAAATARHLISEEGQIIHVPTAGHSFPLPDALTASARLAIYYDVTHTIHRDAYGRFGQVVADCLLPGGEFRGIITTGDVDQATHMKLIGALAAAGLSTHYYKIDDLETVAPTATTPRQSWTGMLIVGRKPEVAKPVAVAPKVEAPAPAKPPPVAAPAHPLLSYLPERGTAIRYAGTEALEPHPNLDAISLENQTTLALLVFPEAPTVRVQPPKSPQVVILAPGSTHDVVDRIGSSYHPGAFDKSEPAVTILGDREESWTESQLVQLHTMGIRLVRGSFIDFDRFRGQHRGTASLFLVFDAQTHNATVMSDYTNTILAPGGELRLVLTDDGKDTLPQFITKFTTELNRRERYDVQTVRVRLPNWKGVILMASRPDPMAQTLGEMQRSGAEPDFQPSSLVAEPHDRFSYAPDRMVRGGLGLGGLPDPNGRDRGPWG